MNFSLFHSFQLFKYLIIFEYYIQIHFTMSRAHFHPVQSLLASIDGELCRILKQVNEEPEPNHNSRTFDKKWIPHLNTIVELATIHSEIYKQY